MIIIDTFVLNMRKVTFSLLPKLRKLIFSTIDYLHVSEDTFFIFVALIIGIGAGYASILFRLLLETIQNFYLGSAADHVSVLLFIPLWVKFLVASSAGLIVGLMIHYWAEEARGAGIPEVMEAVALKNGVIRPRLLLVKSLCASMTIGFGGSAGREGPLVQIGSSIGSSVGQFLGVSEARMRILVACGAASGIAATFNAPIAGVFFAIEIILGSYALSTLTPLILSSVFATIISRMHLGQYPFIKVPIYSMVSAYEVIPYIILGLVTGVFSVVFIESIYRSTDLFDKVKLPPYWRTALGMGCAGMILHIEPKLFGMGYESISQALKGEIVIQALVFLVVIKMIATSLTLGSGASGGIFAPALFVGALLGSAFGIVVNQLMPGMVGPPGAYALVGMGAMVAGTTHGTVTAIIMLFELTEDYKIVLPLMIACMIASIVASKLKNESMYTEKLRRKGININRGIEATVMGSIRCSDVYRPELPIVKPDDPFKTIARRIITRPHHMLYVVDTNGLYMGTISLDALKTFILDSELEGLALAVDLMEPGVTVHENDLLTNVIRQFGIQDREEFPVLQSDGIMIGTVSRFDILRIYSLEVIRKDPVGVKFLHRGLEEEMHTDYVELPKGYKLESFPVSRALAGKTFRELDIRAKYGITVLAVKSAFEDNHPDRDIPTPDTILKQYHRLIVVGNYENLDNFRKVFKIK